MNFCGLCHFENVIEHVTTRKEMRQIGGTSFHEHGKHICFGRKLFFLYIKKKTDLKSQGTKGARWKINQNLFKWKAVKSIEILKCQTSLTLMQWILLEYLTSLLCSLFYKITLLWWIVLSFTENFSAFFFSWCTLQPEKDETRTNKWNQEPLWQVHHVKYILWGLMVLGTLNPAPGINSRAERLLKKDHRQD